MFAGLLILFLLGCFVALLIRVERIAGRLTALERQLLQLQGTSSQRMPAPTAQAPPVTAAPPPLPATPPITTAPPPPPVRPPSRSKEEWEALIGGKLLNRIGAVALIIGVGFFLKYAFENDWITETSRVAIGAIAGLTTLALAHRTRRRGFEIFAQGLVGAGIAILYLSVYASFNYYSLVSQPVAFVLMSIVTAVAFWQAVRYGSLAIALLAWFGGFLTPILLSTGEPNQIGLFSYVAILDAGIIALLVYRNRWTSLEALAIAGTSILYALWFVEQFDSDYLWSAAGFLLLFWGLFHGYDLSRVLRPAPPAPRSRILIAAENGCLTAAGLAVTVYAGDRELLGESLALLGGLYALSAAVATRANQANRTAFLGFALTAAILFAGAIAAEFERFTLTIAFTLEALVVGWIGAKAGYRTLVIVSEILLLIGLFAFLNVFGAFAYQPIGMYVPIWNERTIALAILGVGCALNAFVLKRSGRSAHAELLAYGWILVLLIAVTVEINDLFRAAAVDASELGIASAAFQRYLTIAGCWSFIGLILVAVARRRPTQALLVGGIWALLIGVCLAILRGIAYSPVEIFIPIVNYRMGALLFITGASALTFVLLGEMREKTPWAGTLQTVLRLIVTVLLFVLLTGEIRDLAEHRLATLTDPPPDQISELENLKQLGLSGGWLLYSIGLMGVGLWRRARALRIISIVLFGGTILKIFTYDLSFLDTVYRFISFVALGAILLLVSYLYQRYREVILGPSSS